MLRKRNEKRRMIIVSEKVSQEVLNQLGKPQRTVVKICEDNWDRIKKPCPDVDGNICGVTGKVCAFSNCIKLKEAGSE
ncbi:hypothetical protein AKJ40_00665 [candidate division MSBL1 archaeon SCGC-AAA259M10]|uniref:Uncharacterized protein n=1 Tax=candidate division MSBL1 archaeon SCGC-AAA259M10 TaxID=1698270 RepID=A0A133V2U1_9EURY|nr:hypothetical protein AKJ40_00665 [candidate division MSBL1 archaeon SCGC-AAA259M10]